MSSEAVEVAAAVRRGERSARQVVEECLQAIAEREPEIHAFNTVLADEALAAADTLDRRVSAGEDPGPLAGVPVAVKDNLCTRGVPTTCSSRILEGWRPPYDATVVADLTAAGGIVVGKTNMDEFAMGSSTENSAFGPTRNPWDLERVPGGSSGGSVAAVASGAVPWAWGTDTGGSIRQPAALCGLVGVKPTYGLVSRYGMIAFASSLDQAGPLTRSVSDAAALLNLAAGGDDMDSTCLREPVPDLLDGIDRGIDGMRIGIVKEFQGEGSQPGVRARVDESITRLEKLGATLEEVSLPSFEHGISAYYLIAPAECSSNLARYDGVRYGRRAAGADDIVSMTSRTREQGFGPEVKRRIMLGTYALSAGYYDAYYGKAQKVRTLIARDLERAYQQVDLIVCPTSPTTAFRLGERTSDPLAMYLSDVFTVPVNLAGSAAISVPCGLSDDDGLPVGLQIIARSLDEKTMFRAAYAFEQDLGFDARPQLCA